MAHEGFSCIHCGARMPWEPGADLHCGEDCVKERAKAVAEAVEALCEAGFEQHPEAPNMWLKDFVAITIEQVLNDGIETTLAAHTIAAQHKKPEPRLDLVQKLLQSHEAHVRDLQVLLDKSCEREAELAGMVKMVMEERFYRPVITRDDTKPRQQAPIVPLESLNDVASFVPTRIRSACRRMTT
jgi:hypothetical protein